MKSKYGSERKNDFFYALVTVAMFVVSTLGVGAIVVNAGAVSVAEAVARAVVTAATTYFASG